MLDPTFKPSPAILKLLGPGAAGSSASSSSSSYKHRHHRDPARLLKAYRRGDAYLKRFSAFETLQFTGFRELERGPGAGVGMGMGTGGGGVVVGALALSGDSCAPVAAATGTAASALEGFA